MPKTHEHRVHGDGRLVITEDFFALDDFSGEDGADKAAYKREFYSMLSLARIKYEISYPTDIDEFSNLLLAVRQKYQVAYSNGCHRPRKATAEFLQERFADRVGVDGFVVVTGQELLKAIKASTVADGSANLLFQLLIQETSEDLRNELLSFEPWDRLSDQEDDNLPESITSDEGKGFGLANSRQYFRVIKPLRDYIFSADASEERSIRYDLVLEFFSEYANRSQSLDELAELISLLIEVVVPMWNYFLNQVDSGLSIERMSKVLSTLILFSEIRRLPENATTHILLQALASV